MVCGFSGIARNLSSVIVLGGLVAMTSAPAFAQANCDMYGRLALQQQQENEQRRCGLAGPEWTRDLKAHVTWCASVAPALWNAELKKRAEQLLACAKK